MTSVRTSFTLLKARLGEPESIDVDAVRGATIMMYKLIWGCGCKAAGSGTNYTCRPCAKHAPSLQRAG
jgi:hypothetical protein